MAISIDYRLLLVQPSVVFAARVNQASFTQDAAQVAYDSVTAGTYTDVLPEMMILLGTTAGSDDLGRARVRKAPTSDTIYFGWASRAAGEGELYLTDDAYITVIDLYKPWTKNPRINEGTGTQYLDYDRDFATYQHSEPVVNLDCGPAVQADLDSVTNLATFSFSATNTYMTDPDAAALFTAFDWVLPPEATVTAGAIDTYAVTFTLPVGAWWVTAYETASTGAVGVRHVLCVAGEPDGTLSKFDNIELVRRPEGQVLRTRISESVPESTYPNGCMAVLWKHQYHDGVAVTPSGLAGHEHIAFIGWHYTDETTGRATERGFIDDTILEFRDVGGWLRVLPGYPITVLREGTPSSWFELKDANIDYYAARLLLQYTNVVTLTDYMQSMVGETYQFPSLESKGNTLYEQVDGRAQAIAHKLTCDQWGRLAFKADPQLLDSSGGATAVARTSTVQKALAESDWSEWQASAMPFPRVNWNWGEAIVAKSVDAANDPAIETVFCVMPGRAPSQGTATQQTGEQLVTGQAELNAREGHRYAARMNNPLPSVEIVLAGPDDFAIQPAYMTWISFTNSSATAGQRQRLYTAARFLPVEVTVTHDAERGTQRVTVVAEREVYGSAAATYYPPSNDFDVPETPLPDYEVDTGDANLGPGLNKLFLVHKSGEVSITSNFQAKSSGGGPSYIVVDLGLSGDVLDAVVDPYSPLYLGTGTTVNAWVVTTQRIYYVTDIAGVSSRSVTSQHTFAAESDYRTIQTERSVQNWVIVSSYYEGAGVKAARTTNGSTWTEVLVSGDYIGGITYVLPPGVPEVRFTGESYVDEGGAVAYSVTPLYSGLGVEVSITFSSGNFRVIGLNIDMSASSSVSNLKLDVVGNPNIPYRDWYSSCPGTGDWRPVINDTITNKFPVSTEAITGGYRYTYSGLTDATRIIGYGANMRGCPSTGFPGGTYTFQIIISEINGVSTQGTGDLGDKTPTVHVSGKALGLAYTGGIFSNAGKLYKSTDYGATWAPVSVPYNNFGDSLGGALMFPWHDNSNDRLYYWGALSVGGYSAHRTAADGVTPTVITPSAGYGPADPKCWSASATNRLNMALMSTNGTNVLGHRSEDGGDTWTQIMPSATRANSYVGVHVADDAGVMYFFGPAGVGYSDTAGVLIDDRKGSASTSDVVLIGGW